jgi:hypothetical protein
MTGWASSGEYAGLIVVLTVSILAGSCRAQGTDKPFQAAGETAASSGSITRDASAPVADQQSAKAEAITLEVTGKPLADALTELRARSGVDFDLRPELADDLVSKRIREANWRKVFEALLAGYNYEAILDADGRLRKIVVSGRNGNGAQTPATKRPAAPGSEVAPGSEELVSYAPASSKRPDRYRRLRAGSVVEISLPLAKLKRMKLGEKIKLSLPVGRFEVIHDNRFDHENGDITWVGSLAGAGVGYRVMVTTGEHGSIGQVVTPDGVFNIEAEAGRHWLIDIKRSGLRPGSLEHDAIDGAFAPVDPKPPNPVNAAIRINQAPMAVKEAAAEQAAASSGNTTAKADEPSPTIDVLVLYTKGMLNRGIQPRLNYLVDKANQAYIDSGIKLALKVVAKRLVDYTDLNDNSVALDDLTGGRQAFAAVNALRRRHGADLVSLLRPFRSSQHNGCGISWINGSGGSPLSAALGYSVVSDGMDGAWYCTDYTFVHEVGHNLGSDHDLAHGGGSGHFPFSNGFGFDGKFGTIMSYFDPQVGLFSGPGLICGGEPCGDAATADNVRSISQTAQEVAGFYRTVVPSDRTSRPRASGRADLAATIKVDKKKVRLGKNLRYQLTARNLSAAPAKNVFLVSTFTLDGDIVSSSRHCSFVDDRFVCQIGTLKGKSAVSRSIVVRASEVASLIRTVQIQGDVDDPKPSNNQASVVVSVEP